MLRIENDIWLYALLIIPVLVLLYFLYLGWRKRALRRLGESKLIGRLMPEYSSLRLKIKFALGVMAVTMIILALANPQLGSKLEKVKRKGVDVIVAIDVSTSMLAEDVQPSRIERAKSLVARIIDRLKGDRIGLIVFAGNAYLQMPLTVDYAAAKLFLKTINTDMVPTQGTAIGDAIELAQLNFDQESEKHKALILITDGENHETDAVSIATDAAKRGIKIFTMGVGSEEGGKIPVYVNRQLRGYKRDQADKEIISRLNEDVLLEMAEATKGEYLRIIGDPKELSQVFKRLDSMEKKDFEEQVFTDYDDKFQYFIAFALLLLLIDFFISERKRGWFRNWKFFGAN